MNRKIRLNSFDNLATAIVPMAVVLMTASKVVIAVNDEQFEREKLYQASMSMFRMMLKNGLITEEQYSIIDKKMLEKYHPLLGELFATNPLT